MKKFALVFFVALLASLFSFAETDLPHITVYGTAEEMVVPNELIWSLSIKTVGASVEEVATNHLKDVSALLGYLKGSVPEKDIKTSRMQLKENWVYRDRSDLQEGYYAYTAISFKSTDFSKYMDYWKQLSKFNNLRIGNVSFDVSNRVEIQKKARLNAVSAAKEKAEALAKASGATLLEPLAIEEIQDDSVDFKSASFEGFDRMREPASSIAAGELSIKSQVKLVFRITK